MDSEYQEALEMVQTLEKKHNEMDEERYEIDPPPMYVGIGACIAFRFGGNPPKGLSKLGFNRSDITIPFLFFLLLVDIFLFRV